MQSAASPGDGRVDGQDTTGERWEHMTVEPPPQDGCLRGAAPPDQQHAFLQLQVVMTDTWRLAAETLFDHPRTWRSIFGEAAFRNSEMTLVSSRYIHRNSQELGGFAHVAETGLVEVDVGGFRHGHQFADTRLPVGDTVVVVDSQ